MSDEHLSFPPVKIKQEYKVCESNLGKYVVVDSDESLVSAYSDSSEAFLTCGMLNNAFKMGAASVLHKLNSFSVDIRRDAGIVWGGESNQSNH